jgi:hypothetical protein
MNLSKIESSVRSYEDKEDSRREMLLERERRDNERKKQEKKRAKKEKKKKLKKALKKQRF